MQRGVDVALPTKVTTLHSVMRFISDLNAVCGSLICTYLAI